MEPEPMFETDSDESDDLPDIFENCSQDPKDLLNDIAAGDIIWAEFREFYWPALVRKVYKKLRKMSIWYLDSPRKCFKVPFKKIFSFKDTEASQMIRKQVSESPIKQQHDKVLSTTLTYIRRRGLGYNDDPGKFFDIKIPYLSFKNLKEDVGDINLKPDAEKSNTQDLESNSLECSDVESSIGSDENYFSRDLSILDDSEDEPPDVNKEIAIVSCIISGQTDKYLLGVRSGKIPSKFQAVFEDAMQTDRRKLWSVNSNGNLRDPDKLAEVHHYLLNLYEKVVDGGKCEMCRYINYVWRPEAIAKANEIINKEPESPNKDSRQCPTIPEKKPVNGKRSAKKTSAPKKCKTVAKQESVKSRMPGRKTSLPRRRETVPKQESVIIRQSTRVTRSSCKT